MLTSPDKGWPQTARYSHAGGVSITRGARRTQEWAPDIWYVAIPDMSEAMEAVAHKSGAIIDSRCIRRELSARDIKSLGVAPGSVKLAPKPGET